MKTKRLFTSSAALLAAGLFLTSAPAHAGHVYAGITDTNGSGSLDPGDALSFVSNTNGSVVTGQSQGLQTMNLVGVGTQSGLYMTSNISYTSLSNGHYWTGSTYATPSAFASKTGSFIELQIASLSGPLGAHFSWWDTAVDANNPVMTFTIGGGLTYIKPGWEYGNGFYNLTDPSLLVGDGMNDGNGEPPTALNGTTGADPYGHIHGRSYAVDTPGNYTVSYVLHDLNGVQADSSAFVVNYGAVPEPSVYALLAAAGGFVFFAVRRRKPRVS